MKNLIFVCKDIGLKCLKFHLENFPNDDDYIVVGEPYGDEIQKHISSHGLINYCHVNDFNSKNFNALNFDWLLNLWGGYVFKEDTLSLVRNSLNIHPSYLPFGRGRDPIVWSIMDCAPAGVTLHSINLEVDEGDIYYQEETKYKLPIKGDELYSRVIETCVKIFKNKWPEIRSMSITPIAQKNSTLRTMYRKDLVANQLISYESLDKGQRALVRKLMAYEFDDGYSALMNFNNDKYKVKLVFEKLV